VFRFANVYYLILLLPLLLIFFYGGKKERSLNFPNLGLFKRNGLKTTSKHKISKYFLLLGLIFFIVALARPQRVDKKVNIKKDGIDIVTVLDISRSMLSEDFKPNRINAAKDIISNFVSKRVDDRVGLVVFAGGSFTKIPLTYDHEAVRDSLVRVRVDDIREDGTAIGSGLGVALNRLKKSDAKSKVVLLVTDGENNAGEISPRDAMRLAEKLGIKIYTIGVGAEYIERDMMLFKQRVKNNALDENLLKEIADKTGGKYFRATDNESFEDIFKSIDSLEKSKRESRANYKYIEYFKYLLLLGLVCLILFYIFEYLIFITIP